MPFFADAPTGPNAGLSNTTRPGVFQFEQTTSAAALGAAGTIVVKRRSLITQKVIRWRLHAKNVGHLANTIGGALSNFAVYYGQAARNASNEITAGTVSTPLGLNMNGSTLVGANELISDWIPASTYQPGLGKETMFNIKFDVGAGDAIAFGGGEQWYSVNQPGDATSATPGTMTHVSSQAFINLYIEFEFADDSVQILLNGPGNSLSGGGNGASPNYENRGELDSWGGQWALRHNGVHATISVAGAWAAHYTASDPKWNYYNTMLNPLVPDVVTYLCTMSSDIIGSGSYSSSNYTTAQNSMIACMAKGKLLYPNARHIISNCPPRLESTGTATASLEGDRLKANRWLESSPCGAEVCVDIDRIATDWGNPARLRSMYDPGDGIHGRPRYYAEIAAAMGAAIGPRRKAI